jgi:hypothetical protein
LFSAIDEAGSPVSALVTPELIEREKAPATVSSPIT